MDFIQLFYSLKRENDICSIPSCLDFWPFSGSGHLFCIIYLFGFIPIVYNVNFFYYILYSTVYITFKETTFHLGFSGRQNHAYIPHGDAAWDAYIFAIASLTSHNFSCPHFFGGLSKRLFRSRLIAFILFYFKYSF